MPQCASPTGHHPHAIPQGLREVASDGLVGRRWLPSVRERLQTHLNITPCVSCGLLPNGADRCSRWMCSPLSPLSSRSLRKPRFHFHARRGPARNARHRRARRSPPCGGHGRTGASGQARPGLSRRRRHPASAMITATALIGQVPVSLHEAGRAGRERARGRASGSPSA